MSDPLITWLRAVLDDDEQIARAALDPKHSGEWVWRKDSRTTVRTEDGTPIEPAASGVERGPHIARWHPARVLAEIAAKRAILDHESGKFEVQADVDFSTDGDMVEVTRVGRGTVPPGRMDVSQEEFRRRFCEPAPPSQIVRILAQPYAGRPGYQDQWRPA